MSDRKKVRKTPIAISPFNSTHRQRLWTPWRLKYVAQETIEEGCIFCNRLARANDTASLILRRADHAVVIRNLYPYNTGHVMIVPNRHVADPAELTSDELTGLGNLLPETLAALRRVLNPAGFNIGMNIGAVAGAGVADHLHQHVVPRWQGDANFMPIIAGAVVMPELIPATYAKVRSEFDGQSVSGSSQTVAVVVLNSDFTQVLLTKNERLPTIDVKADESVAKGSISFVRSLNVEADIVGWAGNLSTLAPGRAAIAFLAASDEIVRHDLRWIQVEAALKCLVENEDRDALQNALKLDLSIVPAPPG
jgi:ATP adenylyltransferase